MKRTMWLPALVLAIGWIEPEPGLSQADPPTARGEYLVHHVAMCVQCHSPRDAKGELISLRLLSGANIPIASPYRNQPWASFAPKIAGLPGWVEEDFITLLMTGSRPTGETPRRPMPPFRTSREDAEAIASYLKSVR